MSVRIHNPATMRDADWPTGDTRLRAYAEAFSSAGSQRLISNLRTTVMVLRNGELSLPLTVNDTEYDNSYVCSPYTAYALYSKEEMRLLSSGLLRRALGAVADTMGAALRAARINRMVQVNNWMLSTNLFPRRRPIPIEEMTEALVAAWPDHFICVRSLNGWDGALLRGSFRRAGYKLVASRQVYIYECPTRTWLPHSNAKHDLRLLRHSRYRVERGDDFAAADFDRAAELYAMLYLHKYSQHNPAFTAEFLRLCHRSGVMRFLGLRNPSGVLDGVLGMFCLDGTITAPVVGYDTTLDRRLGLYRMLMTLVFETAVQENLDINLSSGAASFKRLRGGRPYIEYSAIYDRHLPAARRLVLGALAAPVNGIGVPLMRRLQL